MKLCFFHFKLLLIILMFLPSLSAYSSPKIDRIQALEEKVKKLEKKQEGLTKRQDDLVIPQPEVIGPVHSFFNDELLIGGFFEPAYSIFAGTNTKFQAAETQSLLGLNISASFSSRMRFVSQLITALSIPVINEHNDPHANRIGLSSQRTMSNYFFGALIAQAFIEYRMSDHFLIQGGMGYVPFGYANQKREPVLFERRGGPQMLQITSMIAPLWSGVNLQGAYSLDKGGGNWGYNLYSFSPVTNLRLPGMGGHVWWSEKNEDLKFGISGQVAKLGGMTSETVGTDAQIKLKPFSITSEYVYQFVHSGDDPWSIYIEPSINIYREMILGYIFADYAENPLNKTGAPSALALSDPYKQWQYGAGANWLPTSFVRLRLGLTYHDYVGISAKPNGQSRNYLGIDLSAGISF